MILANKAELTLDTENLYHDCLKKYSELEKIYGFIDLPEHVSQLERNNSKILRVYYANALDHNLIDINTVKYIVDGKIKPKAIAERGIEQYIKAEDWLNTQLNSPLSISMLYHLQKLLIVDLYNNREDVNLFSANTTRFPEKLNNTTELEIDALFEFLNNDTEVHPIMQSWMLHFKLLQLHLFSEANAKIACLLQNFWLTKKQFNFMGLLSLEHELYINKTEYQVYLGENRDVEKIAAPEEESISFGMQIFANQILRLKTLLRTYFRRQVEFDKLGPRQKNIMNYVFEHGYLLKEYDDNVLNQRQKLIMYIIQHRGFISTKELVSEFECNRKTIQRDFTTLLELNLVKVIGKGAGLKYAVNVTENKHEYLNKYQSPLVAENTEMSHEA
ncbi:MAG: Fic family protein [Bacteroidia bacterium]|nr:Fic family protein [Bacteroidia bacterium]